MDKFESKSDNGYNIDNIDNSRHGGEDENKFLNNKEAGDKKLSGIERPSNNSQVNNNNNMLIVAPANEFREEMPAQTDFQQS